MKLLGNQFHCSYVSHPEWRKVTFVEDGLLDVGFVLDWNMGKFCTFIQDENLRKLLTDIFKICTPINLRQFITGLSALLL